MSTETPVDLKKTVNLPKTGFSQKANLSQSEPARLKKWSEARLYDLIQKRARAERSTSFMTVRPMQMPTSISARR